jgi:hypothetical protein
MSTLDLEATPWRPTWSGMHLKKRVAPSIVVSRERITFVENTTLFGLRFVIAPLSLETSLPGLRLTL